MLSYFTITSFFTSSTCRGGGSSSSKSSTSSGSMVFGLLEECRWWGILSNWISSFAVLVVKRYRDPVSAGGGITTYFPTGLNLGASVLEVLGPNADAVACCLLALGAFASRERKTSSSFLLTTTGGGTGFLGLGLLCLLYCRLCWTRRFSSEASESALLSEASSLSPSSGMQSRPGCCFSFWFSPLRKASKSRSSSWPYPMLII